MSGDRSPKDPAICEFLERLTEAGREWGLPDHWDGDLCAVGVARPGAPGQLAYVSCWGQPPARYHVELEVADPDEGYATTRLEEALTLVAAVDLVVEHLSAKGA